MGNCMQSPVKPPSRQEPERILPVLPAEPKPKKTPSSVVTFEFFKYSDLVVATDNFKKECEVSDGSRQTTNMVYRGQLHDGRFVAIKRFQLRDWPDAVAFKELSERIGRIRFDGFVSLIGVCCEDEVRLVVADYMPGSLTHLLFHWEKHPMTWLQRLTVAARTARTLQHLEGLENLPMYHDLTVDRVLFASDGKPHLSSFGIMKPQGEGEEFSMNLGDIPPEYIFKGHLVRESVVWSFGTLLLALLSGKSVRATLFSELVENQKPLDPVVDSALKSSKGMAVDIISLVASCLQQKPEKRPPMRTVLEVLNVLEARAQGSPRSSLPPGKLSRFGTAAVKRDFATLHEMLVNQMYGTPPQELSFETWNAAMQEMLNARKLGDSAFRQGNWDDAITHYTLFTKLGSTPLHLMLARRCLCYLNTGKYRLALADAQQSQNVSPSWPEGYYLEGSARTLLGMEDDARAAISAGIRHEQSNSTSTAVMPPHPPQDPPMQHQPQSSSFRF